MPDSQNINSQVNLGLPASVPDSFQNEEVKGSIRLFISVLQNLWRVIEQYLGITQKEQSLWQYTSPTESLLAHQLKRLYVIAGEDLIFGAFVHSYDDAGVLKVENANSTDWTKPACGFCSVAGGSLTDEWTEIIIGEGTLPITGLNPGQSFYLSPVDGLAGVVPDTTAGHLEQFLGFGVAADLGYVCISQGVWIKH